ncbi:MAG: hypothetical protein CVV64_12500 [Candidatus Wallbacteria bacterium HGW-Wallbacteria-1]|jgi:hypothetical protein|uniref:Uncharacterized protein n=1 Tax=Candidatus Wallbacteria bacterium HGW-Wallbacteria-1 TaxID=2013854 RepID=A0A2N1PNB6_9BACT|nr:MAG: hypothetical protein CVV64_12500 [Candidatus Wallbacteria bacterium HGW-Wallbacteria-1]
MKLGLMGRFFLEFLIGAITLGTIYFLGSRGAAVMALLAFMPLMVKRTMDERETALFYRAGNATFGLAIATFVIVDFFSLLPQTDARLTIAAAGVMILHGLCGIFFLKTQ